LLLFLEKEEYNRAIELGEFKLTMIIVPLRLSVFFGLTGYSYFGYHPYVSNTVVFCYGFIEIMVNFLIYIVMREERNEMRKVYLREDGQEGE
jgi:hypothetical protein